MRRWCVWYSDGSTFDWRDGDPEAAPGLGVVVIAQEGGNHGSPFTVSAESFKTVHGYDWYIWSGGQWFATNLMGLTQYLGEPGPKVVKLGRWVAEEVWLEAYRQAIEWEPDDDS